MNNNKNNNNFHKPDAKAKIVSVESYSDKLNSLIGLFDFKLKGEGSKRPLIDFTIQN